MGILVYLEYDVVEINCEEKYVVVENLRIGEEFKDIYDKLVFVGGIWLIVLLFEGVNLENVLIFKIYIYVKEIKVKVLDLIL